MKKIDELMSLVKNQARTTSLMQSFRDRACTNYAGRPHQYNLFAGGGIVRHF